jgi:hypothetical protein
MARSIWTRGAVALISAGLGAACVDLFHSTDFDTLCSDPAACLPDVGNEASPPLTDAPVEITPPPIEFCAWSSADARAHAERACGWVGTCFGALEQSSFGACMLRALAAYDCAFNPSLRPRGANAVLWSCLANVTSCDAVSACLFGATSPTCGSNKDAGTFTVCTRDTTNVLECGLPGDINPPVAIEPCVLEGRSCATVDQGLALCVGKHGLGCNDPPTCDGTHAVDCRPTSGVDTDLGLDCATLGAGRCVSDDAGAACAPIEDAGTCEESSLIRCDDAGAAHRCVAGKAVTVDCNAIAQPCLDTAPSALDPTTACRNEDAGTKCNGPDECSGDILRSCAQGKIFEVSCSSLGLGACQKPPPGRGPFATCTRR